MSIWVSLKGGLGNQLFQYAAGRSVADRLGVPLRVDPGTLGESGPRNFELDSFESRLEVARFRFREKALLKSVRGLTKLVTQDARLAVASNLGVALEIPFQLNPHLDHVRTPAILDGYFQSWKYSKSIATTLRDELRAISEPSPWYFAIRDELIGLEDFIGLQVRLGDYLKHPTLGHVTPSYFSSALKLLPFADETIPIVVFSDEVDRVKDLGLTPRGRKIIAISPPRESRPIESLNLMSLARHLIISNSTFGWWAAWLGHTENRHVLVPEPWALMSEVKSDDLVPAEWGQLSASNGDFMRPPFSPPLLSLP